MDLTSVYNQLTTQFPDLKIYQNHPLAPYTTLKIGGPTDLFIEPSDQDQFISILKLIYHNPVDETINFSERNHVPKGRVSTAKIELSSQNSKASEHRKNLLTNQLSSQNKLTILGSGSNVLISDSGIRGIVIKNSSSQISQLDNNQLLVSSGTSLAFTINWTLDHNLLGLEEFAYIPGTIGGAIFGNIHGVNKNNFSKFIKTITVFDIKTSKIYDLLSNDLSWSYDTSYFQSHPELIIISAVLQLTPADSLSAKETVKKIIATKTLSQPFNSAGCTFKNPPNLSTGDVIDNQLHLKGKNIGDTQISPIHANFIVNTGHATAADYLALVHLIQDQALTQLNLRLELEIKLLGEF